MNGSWIPGRPPSHFAFLKRQAWHAVETFNRSLRNGLTEVL